MWFVVFFFVGTENGISGCSCKTVQNDGGQAKEHNYVSPYKEIQKEINE